VTNEWEQLYKNGGPNVTQRSSHVAVMVLDPSPRLIIHGGYSDEGTLGDVVSFDMSKFIHFCCVVFAKLDLF
jgi:hypothetical protein